jgi:hypothetical protein
MAEKEAVTSGELTVVLKAMDEKNKVLFNALTKEGGISRS